MKVHCQKFIAVVLAVVLSIPVFMVPASAAYSYSPSVSDGNAFRLSIADTLSGYAKVLGYDVDFSGFFTFSFNPHGSVTRSQLESARDQYNSVYNQWLRNYGLAGALLSALSGKNEAYISPDPVNGIERLRIRGTDKWVFDDYGRFPYRVISSSGDTPSVPGTVPADVPDTSSSGKNQWVKYAYFPPPGVSLYMSSKSALDVAAERLKDRGENCSVSKTGGYYVIVKQGMQGAYFWSDKDGRPYVASPEPSVTNNDFNIIVDNSKNNSDNVIVDDMKVIDTQNNQMTVVNEFGDKITYEIDSLYWDDSTHSYIANTYNYDIVNNTYNYYTWNITYNITNTYINYIGSNSAYQQEEYKYYYELPDGRSSEDLTADEVGAMSFQFADVKNYARSATDTSLRALYHFDGNTEDSGYFSTQTVFNWTSGASITYMDSASFNGALYLDETAHKFDITLPSNVGSQDFSIQFRHYQASQPDTLDNKNNSFSIGGTSILTWDERSFYWPGSSTALASVPIGSWAEIAFIRHSGILYFYINGLRVASKADTTAYQGKIGFSLGTTSRAYTMLDELRVVNFAIANAGASYQCATVPFDTNLVLVLPDSAFPIADEYWEFNKTGNLISSNDFTTSFPPSGWTAGAYGGYSVSAQFYDGYASIASSYPLSEYNSYFINNISNAPARAPDRAYWYTVPNLPSSAQYFTVSVFDVDGITHSFTVPKSPSDIPQQIKNFSWGSIYVGYQSDVARVYLIPKPGVTFSFRYVEFVVGTIPNSGHKKVSCIYSSEDIQPNTAAVQSEIPVTGYIVGGVRPTFPARGNVWFPVEGSRITACYIYDGSMWRAAGCRYYTGIRWIPIYAFDIYTLADCWDVADAVDVPPAITSESGFWNWWAKQWLDFRSWLKEAFAGLSGGGSGGGDTVVIPPDSTHFPNIPGEDGEENEEGFSIFDIVKSIVDALWSLVTGVFKIIFGGVVSFFFKLTGSINDFFDAFKGNDGVFGFAKYGGADIWD